MCADVEFKNYFEIFKIYSVISRQFDNLKTFQNEQKFRVQNKQKEKIFDLSHNTPWDDNNTNIPHLKVLYPRQ